jgi:hypothetical protein
MMRVFISSTIADLERERSSVKACLEQLNTELCNHNFEVINTWDSQKDVGVDYECSSLDLIRRCDLLLALISDNESNVYFELGYAMASGKQVLIVSPPNKELPSSLKNIRSIKAHSFDIDLINRIICALDVIATSENRTVKKIPTERHIDINSAYNAYLHNPNYFDQMDYKTFEDLVYEWFKANEFDLERAKGHSDGGYDLIIWNYKEYSKTLVGLKKLNKNGRVSINQIQQFIGDIETGRADRGVFITTSDFTDAAKAYVHSTHSKIELWDLEKVFKVLRK